MDMIGPRARAQERFYATGRIRESVTGSKPQVAGSRRMHGPESKVQKAVVSGAGQWRKQAQQKHECVQDFQEARSRRKSTGTVVQVVDERKVGGFEIKERFRQL